MIEPANWKEIFVGREAELQSLQDAYKRAKSGKPTTVAIVAESGFGKTRLVQEFFNWLSTHEDGIGGAGYWPDRLLSKVDNLVVAPDPDQCASDGRQWPYLWAGFRMINPNERNMILGSATSQAEKMIKPHLAAYEKFETIAELRNRQKMTGVSSGSDVAAIIYLTKQAAIGHIMAHGHYSPPLRQ